MIKAVLVLYAIFSTGICIMYSGTKPAPVHTIIMPGYHGYEFNPDILK